MLNSQEHNAVCMTSRKDKIRRVDAFGRVSIPSEIRDRLGLAVGDFVLIKRDGEEVLIRKVVIPEKVESPC
jgi:AbrB family looped-hinge helix DNA binding protein